MVLDACLAAAASHGQTSFVDVGAGQPAPGPAPGHPHANVEHQVVDYYAEACPHCVKFAPQFAKAQVQWNSDPTNDPVQWLTKQCKDSSWRDGRDAGACQDAKIEAYPTVKLFTVHDGVRDQGAEYMGSRDPDSVVAWVKHMLSTEQGSAGVQASAVGPLAVCDTVVGGLRSSSVLDFL
mmetsp:Transcript_53683/g.142748  ORF Transcript_53683/g.142748 Transcript_53683/m.142748 type:complete len:179 (+) Transcript_53683:39-575(+)